MGPSMTDTISRVPYDPELAAVLSSMAGFTTQLTVDMLTPEGLPLIRQGTAAFPIDAQLAQYDIEQRDVRIVGHGGDEILASVFTPRGHTAAGPGFFHTHGGGMIMGDRTLGVPLEWLARFDAVCVSIEYRLAPEFSDPYPVEDCYSGLVWTAEHAEEIGIDPDRLVILGGSAGGGLAAGTTLLARDRRGPKLLGQLLDCPMLDDRDATVSTRQYDGVGVWDRTSNITGWTALLGDRRGGDDVSIYAAPGRATDLSNLPSTFITCGSAEVFRDEDVAYAGGIWAAGGQAELHVFAGGFHGSDGFAPHAAVSQANAAARLDWITRLLGA